jgi:hypothetical protein
MKTLFLCCQVIPPMTKQDNGDLRPVVRERMADPQAEPAARK